MKWCGLRSFAKSIDFSRNLHSLRCGKRPEERPVWEASKTEGRTSSHAMTMDQCTFARFYGHAHSVEESTPAPPAPYSISGAHRLHSGSVLNHNHSSPCLSLIITSTPQRLQRRKHTISVGSRRMETRWRLSLKGLLSKRAASNSMGTIRRRTAAKKKPNTTSETQTTAKMRRAPDALHVDACSLPSCCLAPHAGVESADAISTLLSQQRRTRGAPILRSSAAGRPVE